MVLGAGQFLMSEVPLYVCPTVGRMSILATERVEGAKSPLGALPENFTYPKPQSRCARSSSQQGFGMMATKQHLFGSNTREMSYPDRFLLEERSSEGVD